MQSAIRTSVVELRAQSASTKPALLPSAAESELEPSTDGFSFADILVYQRDVWERSVLFLDILRQRADNALADERAGMPPVLAFDSEMVLDARRFDPPANYALLRITRVGETCLDDCLDPAKPPVLVMDPRAGHGPGIGGFEDASEVGIAMHKGHPVYFANFFPEPCPCQTLDRVLSALRTFVERVSTENGGKSPILYGNCQAGWAIILLAAHCGGLSGTAVLNGSRLSYWVGRPGSNPMRIAGGLAGGVWLTRYLADLGGGRFDGAWLVSNFENLNPEHAYFEKYANLFTKIDSEQKRFLEFERWWNGFYTLRREEIVQIFKYLFVGNQLEAGTLDLGHGCVIDLKAIRNPIVIFASEGDNITPPHQALGWIPIVYPSTDALKTAGQRIVYLINDYIGHLGIFVSANVARLEHRAIIDHLSAIEQLPPGLYEMKIDNPTGDPDCRDDAYHVRFEERDVSLLDKPYPRGEFERVRSMSEVNDTFYRAFASPIVEALVSPWLANAIRQLHPARLARVPLSSEFNPFMRLLPPLAQAIASTRRPLKPDHPSMSAERRAFEDIAGHLDSLRQFRDSQLEAVFSAWFGTPLPPSAAFRH